MVVCSNCSGVLRKLKYTVNKKDSHILHKKTICNVCGLINEWDKYYPDPTLMNKRFYHPKFTKGSYEIKFGTPGAKTGNKLLPGMPKNYGAIADGL